MTTRERVVLKGSARVPRERVVVQGSARVPRESCPRKGKRRCRLSRNDMENIPRDSCKEAQECPAKAAPARVNGGAGCPAMTWKTSRAIRAMNHKKTGLARL